MIILIHQRSDNGFDDPVYETFDSFVESKSNGAAGWLVLNSMATLIKDRNEFCDKINLFQNNVKGNTKPSEKIHWT